MGSRFIYEIKNKENGKKYIGSTTNKNRRKYEHYSRLKRETHCNRYLQNVYNKYGRDSLEFSIIEKIKDGENLLDREQFYIDKLDPEYNISPKANRTEISEETRKRMSKAQSERKLSSETREKMRETQKGRSFTEEHKRKISEAHKGKFGEESPVAKLTRKKVKIILHLLNGGNFTQKKISKMFGVTAANIGRIKKGQTWPHISV